MYILYNLDMTIKTISTTNSNFSDITNINTYSGSFDFLKKEPDLYNISDIKKMIPKKGNYLPNKSRP